MQPNLLLQAFVKTLSRVVLLTQGWNPTCSRWGYWRAPRVSFSPIQDGDFVVNGLGYSSADVNRCCTLDFCKDEASHIGGMG